MPSLKRHHEDALADDSPRRAKKPMLEPHYEVKLVTKLQDMELDDCCQTRAKAKAKGSDAVMVVVAEPNHEDQENIDPDPQPAPKPKFQRLRLIVKPNNYKRFRLIVKPPVSDEDPENQELGTRKPSGPTRKKKKRVWRFKKMKAALSKIDEGDADIEMTSP